MRAAVVALLALVATRATAADVPVAGRRLALRAHGAQRSASIVLRDAALTPPFADPTGGASLVLSAGILAGQCRVEVALPASGWRALGARQRPRGYRYRATSGPIRRVVVRRGMVAVGTVRGAWPCDLSAAQQRLPATVVLRIGTERYCAAFGGTQLANASGRLVMRDAPPPVACPDTDVTVADLNVLHGLACAADTARCRLADRLDLVFAWIVRAGCPDVVTLQEVAQDIAPQIATRAGTVCPFAYEMVYQKTFVFDDEVILTRYPSVAHDVTTLHLNIRNVLHARIDHPIGPLDVFTTHLAASSDGAEQPCVAPGCPAACVAAGATTARGCQSVQVRELVATAHDVATPAIVSGDFNENPSSFAYQQMTTVAGWTDTTLAAGNPECVPATGVGCTSGRVDDALDQLESPAGNESERIDYAFVVPPAAGSLCAATLDGPGDADGDGTATRLFADAPAPACGPRPAPVCWPSDHEGVEVDLECG